MEEKNKNDIIVITEFNRGNRKFIKALEKTNITGNYIYYEIIDDKIIEIKEKNLLEYIKSVYESNLNTTII